MHERTTDEPDGNRFRLAKRGRSNSIVTDRREDGACLGHRKPAVVAEVHWPESAFRHIGRPGRTGVSNG